MPFTLDEMAQIERTSEDYYAQRSGVLLFRIPGNMVGKARPRAALRNNAAFIHTDGKAIKFEGYLRHQFAEAMNGRAPLRGAVGLSILIRIMPTESWSKIRHKRIAAGTEHPTGKPDFDNVIKSICDAMNKIVFVDDKQVVQASYQKVFDYKREDATIIVTPLDPAEAIGDRAADPFDE